MGTMFAPYWDDLYTVNSGFGIFSLTTGTAPHRTFYLEWRNQYFPGTGTADFEAIFYEDSPTIQVIYGNVTNGASSSTEGVQDVDDNIFDQYGCNGAGGTISTACR